MKYIVIITLCLCNLCAKSQLDSSARIISVTMQARDWAYITSLNVNRENYEPIYDELKKKLRVGNAPTGVTPVTVDSGLVRDYLQLFSTIVNMSYGEAAFVFPRINTALRNTADAYLIRGMDGIQDAAETVYNARLQEGLRRMKGARQIMRVQRRVNR